MNSGIDPKTAMDIVGEVHRIVPTRVDYHHTYDTPADASGHVKASLIGGDVTMIITEGGVAVGWFTKCVIF